LGPHALDIKHVGSTAIPGILAKPILDIAVAVACFEGASVCIAPLEALGYLYRGEHGIPRRHYFVLRAPQGDARLVHLHMLEIQSANWEDHLLFRDYLRAHPAEAQAYQALKQQLAARFRHDRHAYTKGKTAFVTRILELARAAPTACQAQARLT
jgi:GrpB-like predicted nucleotidyltransferase (UPF0157 family)